MEGILQLEIGDILELKKKHPCGSYDWKVISVGADIRLECCACGHNIILKRSVLQKSVKRIKRTWFPFLIMIVYLSVIYFYPCSFAVEGT